ncbi:hypothetical protein L2E82_06337 [Cichorium intybus]|uniref:Uncharacterized protein n=1 Tax=Cichorium intybus TaxID=13427 RepID=A0ACB9H9R0_CICIN|nr:hypothetical protein L2E82_06337 [Cichorium intybus]
MDEVDMGIVGADWFVKSGVAVCGCVSELVNFNLKSQTRVQKPLVSPGEKLISPSTCSNQATKRQKLEIGYLQIEGNSNSRFKTTIPPKPGLVTEGKAQRSRSHNKSEKEEWRKGFKALRVDTVTKLKKTLPDLEKEVRRPSNHVNFYSYAFQYCLTEEKQKTIDIESILKGFE